VSDFLEGLRELDQIRKEIHKLEQEEKIERRKTSYAIPEYAVPEYEYEYTVPEYAFPEQRQARLVELKRQAKLLEEQLEVQKLSEPIRWKGEVNAFVREILRWRDLGLIFEKTDSDNSVVERTVSHFRKSNGKPFNVRSALQTYLDSKPKKLKS
jgi:hypothetical protein